MYNHNNTCSVVIINKQTRLKNKEFFFSGVGKIAFL